MNSHPSHSPTRIGCQRPIGGVEIRGLGQRRGRTQSSVEAIGPGVIGATDQTGIDRLTDLHQGMAAMPANIGESVHRPV